METSGSTDADTGVEGSCEETDETFIFKNFIGRELLRIIGCHLENNRDIYIRSIRE